MFFIDKGGPPAQDLSPPLSSDKDRLKDILDTIAPGYISRNSSMAEDGVGMGMDNR